MDNTKEQKFEEFKITLDDKEVEFRVNRPSLADQREANKVRNRTFTEMLKSGAPLRRELQNELKKRGTWNDVVDKQLNELIEKINNGEKRLAQGGFDLDDAKELALQMRRWRRQQRELLFELSELTDATVEGQSDNMAFNYLVSVCTVYNIDGKWKKYFKDLDDYLEKITTEVAFTSASKLAVLTQQISYETDADLAENKFLVDFDFADENLRLVNEDGKLVDENGSLVDEFGRLIDEEGNLVDDEKTPITESGDFKVENKGFLKGGKVVFGKSHKEKVEKVEKTKKEKD